MSMDMKGRCTRCERVTADYVITAEMMYALCDTCYYVDIIQLAQAAA